MSADRPPDRSPGPRATPVEGIPIGRGVFLGTLAAGLAALPFAAGVGRAVSAVTPDVAEYLPDEVRNLAPRGGWRIYTVNLPMPRFDPATFTLTIGGLVERPRTLTWAEVASLPGEEQVSDFHCVTGWSVEDVRWEGITPATLIALVRPRPEARYVTMISAEEPYVDQLTFEQFTHPQNVLARHMDGEPLRRPHGAPLRMVIPRMYGYKGVKWVRELRFDAEEDPGYWEQRGYDTDAWVGRSNGYGRA